MSEAHTSSSVAFGCVAEATPIFNAQVLRLIQSIRWFGGSLADADFFVCMVGEADRAAQRDFAALGAQVRSVAEFNPLNRYCNKIRFLELPELAQYETVVLLDCDVALVQDPAPYFAQPALQLKIADWPTVPSQVLARLCAHFGLSAPEPRYHTTWSQEPTIWYCNTGVMILPSAWIAQILPAWREYIMQLCTQPGLFGPPYAHCNQAAMTLAYLRSGLPFSELPAAMNFPLNQTHRLPVPALLNEDPVILHYHNRVDSDGLLLPAPYPLAQQRVQQLNERLREARGPRPAPASLRALPDTRPAPRGAEELSPMPFVIGSEDAGSSLLSQLLGRHPELAVAPETHFIPDLVRACQRAERPAERFIETVTQHPRWPDFQIDARDLRQTIMALEPFHLGDGLRAFYRAYAARGGKRRYGDTTPDYCFCAEQIQLLLPEAHFIHLIRDGRDVAMSLRASGSEAQPLVTIAQQWGARIRAARRQAPELRHYIEVRYEQLVREPEDTLRRICGFLGLEWDPAMLASYERAADRPDDQRRPLLVASDSHEPGEQQPAVDRLVSMPPQPQRVTEWRQALSPDDLAMVEAEVGDLLDELGYSLASSRTAHPPHRATVCITGMHRSGTSLVGQILHYCGPYLGPYRLLAAKAPDNLDGYWEHPDVHALNDDILAHFGGGWDAAPSFPDAWEQLPELEPLRQRARALIDQFDDQPFWGWKDPRTALTMPFWRHLIPSLKVVICVRNPLEVAQSLSQRGMSSLAFGLRLWHTYYERLLAVVPPADRLITHYDAFFVDPAAETRRILDWLGRPASSDDIQRACAGATYALRHQRSTVADLLAAGAPAATLQLYGLLCSAADAPAEMALAGIVPADAASGYAPAAPNAALKAALALLRARDSELAALRPALAASQAELAILRPVLEAREDEAAFLVPALAARESELANYARELAATRDLLAAREAELTATRDLLAARESELANYARELAATRDLLAAREGELADYARELAATRDLFTAQG